MPDDFSSLNEEEKLKSENEFLKMKLMLERGASFGTGDDTALPASVENKFLNYIEEFEKQFEQHKTISVFERINKPTIFKPVSEIPDSEIEQTWKELSDYLNKYGLSLDVCSPNISTRELYRFTTEELFKYEMGDITIPGMMTNFIYDEFYPDPIYDNSRLVEQDLLKDIFRKDDLFYEIHYSKGGFVFNGLRYDDFKIYGEKINRFKSLFDQIELEECNIVDCTVNENESRVAGNYKAVAKMENTEAIFGGDFRIKLAVSELGYWDMKRIQIDGFNPE